jgi:ElaB/YqjD/DUF883 family membrane-anchored ribosome-binding protein
MDAVKTEQLMAELRAVVGRAEELLQAVDLGGAKEGAQEALREVEELVRKNPWAAVAIAAGAGLVLGLLLARK